MGTSLGEAVLEIAGDYTKLEGDIEKAHKTAISKLNKVGEGMKSVGKNMTAAVTLPILGIGVASINAASDLDESRSKVQVVFGDQAAAVEDFASRAAEALGMSEEAALAAAGTYGNLFTSMGMGQDAAADMSMGLVQLAADLASFNNMDPTEVLDKLRAGLTGETEPLKVLGVNLNAAAVEAKAMEMGLIGVDGELTASAKAQATYALILEQTKNAQGDFARTSDGLANSTRIAKAQLQDAAAQLGTQLLSIALQAVNVLKDLLTWFNGLPSSVQQVIVVFLGLAAAIGPLLMIIGSLITSIGAIVPVVSTVIGVLSGPVLAVIAAVVAGIALLALAWKNNFFGIRDTVAAVWSAIQSIFAAFKAAFQGDWTAFGEHLRAAWDTIWNLISGRFETAKETLGNIARGIVDTVRKIFTGEFDWGQLGQNIVQGIANGITSAVDWVMAAVRGLGSAAISAIKGFLGIASPSRLFEQEVGFQMGAGVAAGVDESMSLVERALATNLGNLNINAPGRGSAPVMITVPLTVYGGDPAVVRTAAQDGVTAAIRRLGLG